MNNFAYEGKSCPNCGNNTYSVDAVQWQPTFLWEMVAKQHPTATKVKDMFHDGQGNSGPALCTCSNCKSTLTNKSVGINKRMVKRALGIK